MDNEIRKPNRLQEYDYATVGAYFITICTKDRAEILSKIRIVGEGLCALPHIELTDVGKMVEQSIQYIDRTIPGFSVDRYVIMPNHVHLLITLSAIPETGGHRGPPLHKVIGQFKSYTTHTYGRVLWQRSYYDHVIRGEQDYRDVWEYIDQNPARWREDELYAQT